MSLKGKDNQSGSEDVLKLAPQVCKNPISIITFHKKNPGNFCHKDTTMNKVLTLNISNIDF